MNIKENGLETIIVSHLRDVGGYVEGTSPMYDKSLALVKEWLEAFLLETQAKEVEASAIFKVPSETVKFYNRLASALATRGVVDVLRKGFKYNGQTFKLYYELPSELNETAKANYLKNRFGVIRQLHYSKNEAIRLAFQQYYKTTVLAGESDVNKLNDLVEVVEKKPFYMPADVEEVVRLRLTGTDADRPRIDAMLDGCVMRFKDELKDEEQIKVKHAMKTYCHVYPFLASIMPYESPSWEQTYVFFALLVKKLPVLKREDFTVGLLESIDFDKYRLVKEEERAIEMQNEDAEVKPIPTGTMNGAIPGVELDKLANIVDDFNKEFGGIDWKDADEVKRQILSLPKRIMFADANSVNTVRQGDTQLAQIAFNDGMRSIVAKLGEEKLEFMKTYFMNEQFRNMVNARVFAACLDKIRHGRIENVKLRMQNGAR